MMDQARKDRILAKLANAPTSLPDDEDFRGYSSEEAIKANRVGRISANQLRAPDVPTPRVPGYRAEDVGKMGLMVEPGTRPEGRDWSIKRLNEIKFERSMKPRF